MNISFQQTLEKVMSGTKTQTRRLFKPNWHFDGTVYTKYVDKNGSAKNRTVYYVGQVLTVVHKRGESAVVDSNETPMKIRITKLRNEDVRTISDEDVKAEGFTSKDDFIAIWRKLNDKSSLSYRWSWIPTSNRPLKYYDAVVIDFELVNPHYTKENTHDISE